MARETALRKEQPLAFPPTVKGWWEYKGGEPGIQYVPIVKVDGHPLKKWDFVKIQRQPSAPQDGGIVQVKHQVTGCRWSGRIKVFPNGSAELHTFDDGILKFSKTQVQKLEFFLVLGLVNLPHEDCRKFIEMRHPSMTEWTEEEQNLGARFWEKFAKE